MEKHGKAKASLLLLLLHVCLLLRFDILSETTAVEVTAVLRPALKPSRHTPFPRGPTRMTCQGAFWGLRSTRSQSTSLVMPEAEPHNQCMMSGKVPKHWTFKTHKGVYAERCLMQFRICLEFNPKWTPMQSALPFEERICWRVLLYWDRADPCMRSMFQNIGSFGNFGISMNS